MLRLMEMSECEPIASRRTAKKVSRIYLERILQDFVE